QEEVALKVVEGLKVHLASDEKKKLAERGTENAEAYELYMKAREYFARQTKEGFQLAVQLLTEAIKLDPGYARAYYFKANALAELYRVYDRTLALLDEAETLCKEALRLDTLLFAVEFFYNGTGKYAKAIAPYEEAVRLKPDDLVSLWNLVAACDSAGEREK